MGRRLVVEWFELCRVKYEAGKLYEEGHKLKAEGGKLKAEGGKLWAEGGKLWAEGGKLWAEGDKLWAEGRMEFLAAIINSPDYGPETETQWTDRGCVVGGEEYRFDEPV